MIVMMMIIIILIMIMIMMTIIKPTLFPCARQVRVLGGDRLQAAAAAKHAR